MEKSYTEEFNNWSDIGNEADEAGEQWRCSNTYQAADTKEYAKVYQLGYECVVCLVCRVKSAGEFRINMVQWGRLEIHTYIVLSTI